MEPSDRDLEREIARVDPKPDEPDNMVVWEAFITGTHPEEMDTIAEADAVRDLWLFETDGFEPGDLDDMTAKQVERLDEKIREFEGYDGSGRPY